MSKEKQCKCCHEWWYASEIKNDLCPNCYDYFRQLKQQIEEKDKEIEMLKHTLNLYNLRHKGSVLPNVNQLAIQELEKVKNKCNGMYELWLDSNYKENMYNNEDIAGVFEDISVFTNDLIKKLKGE